jgi:hypothetical protein
VVGELKLDKLGAVALDPLVDDASLAEAVLIVSSLPSPLSCNLRTLGPPCSMLIVFGPL